MPTYEYVCKKCGHELEAVQSFSDAALTTCPECSGPLRKQFGSVGVVFKGSGFYRTDSREENRAKKAEAKSGSGKAEGSGKSDSTAKSEGSGKSDGSSKSDGAKKDGTAPPSKKDSPKSDSNSGTKNKPVEKSSKKR